MGGSVGARIGDLGGLAVDIELSSLPEAVGSDGPGVVGRREIRS
jgi:hypothetical protein